MEVAGLIFAAWFDWHSPGGEEIIANMSITTTQLCSLLGEIPNISVTREAACASVRVPAIDRVIRLDANAVTRHAFVTAPNGDRALLLLLDVGAVPVECIVASTDLVFAPDTRDSGLGIAVDVKNAPPLVGFSEMMRELRTIEQTSSTEPDLDKVFGTLVMLRYFVAGAKRLGIECREAESTWQRAWERTGLSSIAVGGPSGNNAPAAVPRPRSPRPKRAAKHGARKRE